MPELPLELAVMKTDVSIETRKEVSHLRHLSSPNVTPLIMMKTSETWIMKTANKYPMHLNHQGSVNLFFIFIFFGPLHLISFSLLVFRSGFSSWLIFRRLLIMSETLFRICIDLVLHSLDLRKICKRRKLGGKISKFESIPITIWDWVRTSGPTTRAELLVVVWSCS